MKRDLVLLILFTIFNEVAIIFGVAAIILNYSTEEVDFKYNAGIPTTLSILSLAFSIASILGTFITSIILLIQSNKLKISKSMVRVTSILGIVSSSLSVSFIFLNDFLTILSYIGNIMMIIVFAFAVASYFIVRNNNKVAPSIPNAEQQNTPDISK